MNRSIKNGTILGNNMLYGYKKDKITGNLVIINEEAVVVKRIFSLYVFDNYSISKIAKILNDEGIKTCYNKRWCVSTLARMLRNPKYKGYYCGKKTEIIDYMTKKVKNIPDKDWIIYEDRDRIPPIVEEDIWNSANERLRSRKKIFGDDYREDKIMYQNRYSLSAKIYCAEHNEVFHRRMQCRSCDDITWICAKYLKEGKKVCNSPNIRESEIYYIFDDIMRELGIDLLNVSDILLDLYKSSKKNVYDYYRVNELKKERDKILVKKDKLLELNIEGNLSNSEFNNRNSDCNRELFIIDKKIDFLKKSMFNYNDIYVEDKKFEKVVKRKIKDKDVISQLIYLLLQRIVVSKINNDKENIELKVFFKFSKNFLENRVKKIVVSDIDNYINIMRKDYEFKRGYNTISTRRYIVKYLVNSYICV